MCNATSHGDRTSFVGGLDAVRPGARSGEIALRIGDREGRAFMAMAMEEK
jgi:hypothetical protein